MRRRCSLGAIALLAALAGCGGDDSSTAGPEPSTPASASATDGSSDTASASPTETPEDQARTVLKAAVKPLLDSVVIDFQHTLYSGAGLAIQTTGRAFQQAGWEATTVSPKVVSSPDPPTGTDVKGTMQVRAVGDDVFMQLSTWEPPLAGCWLRTGSGQVPGGLLAMTPGVPGFITLLGILHPVSLAQQSADTTLVAADVPLRIGLQLMTTGVLGLLDLDAGQLAGTTVPLLVQVSGGVVTDVRLDGPDLVAAVRTAGGDVSPDAEATIGQLRVDVTYTAGPDDTAGVTAPEDALVMTNDQVDSGAGCAG